MRINLHRESENQRAVSSGPLLPACCAKRRAGWGFAGPRPGASGREQRSRCDLPRGASMRRLLCPQEAHQDGRQQALGVPALEVEAGRSPRPGVRVHKGARLSLKHGCNTIRAALPLLGG